MHFGPRFAFGRLLESLGLLLISFGLIRESFGAGVPPGVPVRPGDQAGIYLANIQEVLLHFGGVIGLLPTEYALSALEKRWDAGLAIAGFLLLVLAAILNLFAKVRGH